MPAQNPLPSPPPIIVKTPVLTPPPTSNTQQPPIVVPVQQKLKQQHQVPTPVITSSSVSTTSTTQIQTITTHSNIVTQLPPAPQPIVSTTQPLYSTNAIYSEQQTTTIHTSSPNSNSNKNAQDQENEQFALAWLRATFEPANILTSRIEQQDLYKMYLTACSKIGRAGVVSQYHFPRCVRNVFNSSVGPNQVKIKQNSMEISSYFYEGIRIRAQPLAVVHKGTILVRYFYIN